MQAVSRLVMIIISKLCWQGSAFRLKQQREAIVVLQDELFYIRSLKLDNLLCHLDDSSVGFLDECQHDEGLLLTYHKSNGKIYITPKNDTEKKLAFKKGDDTCSGAPFLHHGTYENDAEHETVMLTLGKFYDNDTAHFFKMGEYHMNCFDGKSLVRFCKNNGGFDDREQFFLVKQDRLDREKTAHGFEQEPNADLQDGRNYYYYIRSLRLGKRLCYKDFNTSNSIGFHDDCQDKLLTLRMEWDSYYHKHKPFITAKGTDNEIYKIYGSDDHDDYCLNGVMLRKDPKTGKGSYKWPLSIKIEKADKNDQAYFLSYLGTWYMDCYDGGPSLSFCKKRDKEDRQFFFLEKAGHPHYQPLVPF